jgi:hypothetical protein
MAITNGYCTLAELKDFITKDWSYTAETISFTASTKTITDTYYGLKRFEDANNVGAVLKVSGTSTNAGVYTISSVSRNAIVVNEALTDEAAGTSVTIQAHDKLENDTALEAAINAASRFIDKFCGRRFYATTETRYYEPTDWVTVYVGDLLTVTTLKADEDGDGTFETTWSTTDYNLQPYNASTDGKPYTWIEISAGGVELFPATIKKGVEIAGSFGYCATGSQPDDVKLACMIQASRLFKRKDAPFGVAGTSELGVMQMVPKLDPDVRLLLEPYRRLI